MKLGDIELMEADRPDEQPESNSLSVTIIYVSDANLLQTNLCLKAFSLSLFWTMAKATMGCYGDLHGTSTKTNAPDRPGDSCGEASL